ncbi:hypothetical protein DFH09DRAFT_1326597 [Mycena vulgaris]|nr:hypothetical protein DFH09DRAFT_1326597 [Mycena vulgaris]
MTTTIDRELTIELLRCMSVDLPPKTKLPDAELDKRLSKTLDGCQYLTRVVPTLPLDPASYKSWRLEHTNKPVFSAVRRHNVGESSFLYNKLKEGVDNPYPLYVDPFMDLRQSIMTMGKNWDDETKTMMIQDKEQTSCILIRILDVLEFDKQTPVILVLFRRLLRGTLPSESIMKWLLLQKKGMPQIFATPKEQHLFMRLLQRNSERLPASYKPDSTPLEREFTPSFILPVGPLSGKDVAKLNNNDGCSMCGDPAKSKCSRCNVKRYCGAVCQKDDWKAHRPTCTSLKGAKWQTIPLIPVNNFMKLALLPGAVPFRFNRYDNVQHGDVTNPDVEKADFDTPPPNTHGSTPFIVKVQLQLSSDDVRKYPDVIIDPLYKPSQASISSTSLLIYDRRRTFEATVVKFVCPADAFDPVADVVRAKGQRGLKLFCWATRSGDWNLDLCIDQFPEWQQW